MTKTLDELATEGNFLKRIKAIYEKTQSTSYSVVKMTAGPQVPDKQDNPAHTESGCSDKNLSLGCPPQAPTSLFPGTF